MWAFFNVMNKLFKYFFQGLFFLVPITVTLYVIFSIIKFLDNILPFEFPGLGMITVIGIIIVIGFLSHTIIFEKLFSRIEKLMFKVPAIKIVYSSLKDLVNAFVGKKKKFEYPVMVVMNKEAGIKKMGFISQSDLSAFGFDDQVAVYFPHSYAFSGNLFVIPKENIIELKKMNATQAMKFIVSGGMAWNDEDE